MMVCGECSKQFPTTFCGPDGKYRCLICHKEAHASRVAHTPKWHGAAGVAHGGPNYKAS